MYKYACGLWSTNPRGTYVQYNSELYNMLFMCTCALSFIADLLIYKVNADFSDFSFSLFLFFFFPRVFETLFLCVSPAALELTL